jgi:aminoglycoside phosphotransferase (APT) family kinase protein
MLQPSLPYTPPVFTSLRDYRARLADTGFWWPYLEHILECHGLAGAGLEPEPGIGGTYPTFLYGDVAIKLFGFLPSWEKNFRAEQAVQKVLATDPAITVPQLLAEGKLYDSKNPPWPYLIISRIPGLSWQFANLTTEQQVSVAADLGRQLRRIHALPAQGIATHEDWLSVDVTVAAQRSSLPPHLTVQVKDYLARLGPFDRVMVHGDIMFRHVFINNGHLSGIIDWGDAMITDRHYEFARMHLDLFNGDKTVLRAFLDASNWPVDKAFAQKAMGHALYRQAHGLAQHPTMDVFYMLPERLPLEDIPTLDKLALALFSV